MSDYGTDLIVLTPSASVPIPAIIANAGKRASRKPSSGSESEQ
jgi:hypothetical protein